MTATVRRIDGSIPADLTAEHDGNDITGRANLAGYGRGYRSDCCGVVAEVPSHAGYCDRRHAARIWARPAVVAARAYLAQVDAAYEPCEFPRPLADHLRAVLAEIDKEAIDGNH